MIALKITLAISTNDKSAKETRTMSQKWDKKGKHSCMYDVTTRHEACDSVFVVKLNTVRDREY